MEINVDILRELAETPGAPGYEHRIRNVIQREIESHVDRVEIDNMGNLFAVKEGQSPKSKKVMLAAHMDEIGFIVTHIDENGFVRFSPLGGFDPKTLTAQRVIIHGEEDVLGVMGTKPIHLMKPEEKTKQVQLDDFFIDTGRTRDSLEKLIAVGNPITRQRELVEMGPCLNCKSLDNRISVYVLIETIKQLKKTDATVYAVFTVQEEVGLRGAQVASHYIDPDFGIAIDTTIAFDLPGAQPHEKVTALGEGAAIKILDASTICDPRMVRYMKEVAEKYGTPWQPEVLTAGGTDTAGLQRMGKQGSIAGAVSIPTRHLHQVIEMVHREDVKSAIDLLIHSVQDIGSYDWSDRS